MAGSKPLSKSGAKSTAFVRGEVVGAGAISQVAGVEIQVGWQIWSQECVHFIFLNKRVGKAVS